MKSTRLDRRLAIGLLVAVVLISLFSQMLDTTRAEDVEGSVASTAPDGRRALLLMLSELGFATQPWRQVPGALPRGDHLLWIARAPEPWKLGESEEQDEDAGENEPAGGAEPETEDNPAVDTTPSALDLHALAHYRRFLEESGTIVLPMGEATQSFLADILGLEEARDLALVEDAPAGTYRVRTSSGEELDVDCNAGSIFADLDPGGPVRELWFASSGAPDGRTASEQPLAVVFPVANGRVVLLGDDRFLDNARIGARDHALFAVRLLEELAPQGKILFDEYALGLWESQTVFDLATSPRLGLVTLQLLLALLLFVWRMGWVRAFPRDPEALVRVSPLARARAQAGLLVRARRWDLLAGDLRRAVLARLRARARLRPAPGDAARARESVERDLARIAARVGRTDDLARWRETAVERRVNDAAGFEQLARDLARIEG